MAVPWSILHKDLKYPSFISESLAARLPQHASLTGTKAELIASCLCWLSKKAKIFMASVQICVTGWLSRSVKQLRYISKNKKPSEIGAMNAEASCNPTWFHDKESLVVLFQLCHLTLPAVVQLMGTWPNQSISRCLTNALVLGVSIYRYLLWSLHKPLGRFL